ncbi:MAG: hypothetical protein ABJC26_10335 [Gemmatimonadaceae bacterium]
MMTLRSPRKTAALFQIGVVVFGVAIGACDSGKGSSAAKVASGKATVAKGCVEEPGSSAATVAIRDFIKNSDPKPMRFLSAAGTDSAVPEEGLRALQDKGPTYFYAGTDEQKKKVRDKIELAGPFTALLIVMRSDKKNDDGTEVVNLGGHYITGEFDGKAAASHAYTMSCDTSGWSIKSKADL